MATRLPGSELGEAIFKRPSSAASAAAAIAALVTAIPAYHYPFPPEARKPTVKKEVLPAPLPSFAHLNLTPRTYEGIWEGPVPIGLKIPLRIDSPLPDGSRRFADLTIMVDNVAARIVNSEAITSTIVELNLLTKDGLLKSDLSRLARTAARAHEENLPIDVWDGKHPKYGKTSIAFPIDSKDFVREVVVPVNATKIIRKAFVAPPPTKPVERTTNTVEPPKLTYRFRTIR